MTWELTPELETEILTALEDGIGLNTWCKGNGRPSRSTVLKWQREKLDFQTKCAHAREAAGDLAAEKHNEVIEGCLSGIVPSDIAGRVLSGLEWRASKLASKKYGNKQVIAGDPDAPLTTITRIQRTIIDPKDVNTGNPNA